MIPQYKCTVTNICGVEKSIQKKGIIEVEPEKGEVRIDIKDGKLEQTVVNEDEPDLPDDNEEDEVFDEPTEEEEKEAEEGLETPERLESKVGDRVESHYKVKGGKKSAGTDNGTIKKVYQDGTGNVDILFDDGVLQTCNESFITEKLPPLRKYMRGDKVESHWGTGVGRSTQTAVATIQKVHGDGAISIIFDKDKYFQKLTADQVPYIVRLVERTKAQNLLTIPRKKIVVAVDNGKLQSFRQPEAVEPLTDRDRWVGRQPRRNVKRAKARYDRLKRQGKELKFKK